MYIEIIYTILTKAINFKNTIYKSDGYIHSLKINHGNNEIHKLLICFFASSA